MVDITNREVKLTQNIVTEFIPTESKVKLIDGTVYEYKNLVVALGLKVNFSAIEGLEDAIERHAEGICSNYSPYTVERTFLEMNRLVSLAKSDPTLKLRAIFTAPNTPIKCGGGPQKAAHLAWDFFTKQGVIDQIDIEFVHGGPGIFPQPDYAKKQEALLEKRGIKLSKKENLVKIDASENTAIFDGPDGAVERQYDMIHIVPPQGPLDVSI